MDKIMSEVCVFLADGFEEIEGLTVVDLLRRAGIETRTVSIMGQEEIKGAKQTACLKIQIFQR